MTSLDDRARRAAAEARGALERAAPPPDLGPLAARRARRRRAGAGVVAVLAAVAGGLAYRSVGDAGTVRVGTGPQAVGQLMSCGDGVVFPVGALEGPIGAEQAGTGAAAALQRDLPTAVWESEGSGWRVLSSGDDAVVFGNVAGAEVLTVVVGRDGDDWTVTSVLECRPVPYRPGHRVAGWSVDPGRPPSRDDSVVHVRVREWTCTTAPAPGDRVADPVVERSSDAVTITFFERLPEGDRLWCTQGPSVPVTVDLGEPIGDRELRDGGTWPPTPQPVLPAGGTVGGFAAQGGCGDVFLWAADGPGTVLLAVLVDGALASAPGVVEVDLPSDRATVEVRRGRDLTGVVCTDLPSPDATEDAVMPAVAGHLRLTLGTPAADGTAVADLVVTGVEVEGPGGERLPVEDVTVEDVTVGWFAG